VARDLSWLFWVGLMILHVKDCMKCRTVEAVGSGHWHLSLRRLVSVISLYKGFSLGRPDLVDCASITNNYPSWRTGVSLVHFPSNRYYWKAQKFGDSWGSSLSSWVWSFFQAVKLWSKSWRKTARKCEIRFFFAR